MKPKIALFVPSLSGGGAERVIVNLARGFAEEGHPVDLVLAKAEGPYLKDVPESVRIVDLASPRVLQSLPGLVKYLRRERPHALLSALDHANLVALWAKRIANVQTKVIVTIHSTISLSVSQARNRRTRLIPMLIKRLYRRAHNVIAVSEGVAEDFVKVTGTNRNKVKVIYNPIITQEMFSRAEEPIDHPWFSKNQPPVIVGVGRLTAAKDFPTLIRAFARVRRERTVRLVILGEGEDRASIQRLAENLGVQDDLWMPGFVENPYAYMSKAKVFVLSSLWEGLPTVIIESIALGIPVIATDCKSGPAEIFSHLGCGTLVKPSNSRELAEAIDLSIKSTTELKGKIDVSLFSTSKSVHDYIEVLG